VAVPLIVTVSPLVNVAPAEGEVMADAAGVVSVDAVADVRPESSVAG
jgi:hypothetical protein